MPKICATIFAFFMLSLSYAAESLTKSFFIDTTAQVTLHYFQENGGSPFTSSANKLVFGSSSKNALWLKIEPTNTISRDHYVLLTNAHLDSVDVYKVYKNGEIAIIQSGDHRPFNTRELDNNYFGFVFSKDIKAMYIRIRSEGTLGTPVELYKIDDFFHFYRKFVSLMAFYIGISVLTLLLTFFFAYRLKTRLFLYYGLGTLGFLLFTLVDKGYVFQYVWPNMPQLNKDMLLFYAIPFFVISLFSMKFLEIRRAQSPVIFYIYQVMLGVLLVSVVLNLFGEYNLGLLLYQVIAVFLPFFIFSQSIYFFIKAKTRAVFLFLIAWSSYLTALVVYMLAYYDVLNMTFFTEYVIQYAHTFDILLLFVAVIDKVSVIKEEKDQATENLLKITQEKKDLLKDQAVKLEETVKIRTDELVMANEEMRSTNEELYSKNELINTQNNELKDALQQLQSVQMQLLQSEKMASLGVLTAGIAHEINNPLNFILSNYYGLQENIKNVNEENSDETKKMLKGIETGVDRIVAIVKGLNQYSRQNDFLDEKCDIVEIINGSIQILRSHLKDKVKITCHIECDSCLIKGNVGKLHQVFSNVIYNAVQAIPKKGQIQINVKPLAENVSISIIDNGIGISPENLSKIADPFFTTKQPGEGTGLGLAIAFSIVKEHGGTIEVNSELGKGTEVCIRLPFKQSSIEK